VIAVVGTLICYFLAKVLCGGSIRVEKKEEMLGLDVTQHGESAYPSFNGLE
jgi:Amt family ammonium transporter